MGWWFKSCTCSWRSLSLMRTVSWVMWSCAGVSAAWLLFWFSKPSLSLKEIRSFSMMLESEVNKAISFVKMSGWPKFRIWFTYLLLNYLLLFLKKSTDQEWQLEFRCVDTLYCMQWQIKLLSSYLSIYNFKLWAFFELFIFEYLFREKKKRRFIFPLSLSELTKTTAAESPFYQQTVFPI